MCPQLVIINTVVAMEEGHAPSSQFIVTFAARSCDNTNLLLVKFLKYLEKKVLVVSHVCVVSLNIMETMLLLYLCLYGRDIFSAKELGTR